jgi:nucleotide-binding universal stress UspA family protein
MIEFKRIVCPVDFSASSARAFAYAAAFARWYDAQLTVLHVVPLPEPTQVYGPADPVLTPKLCEEVIAELGRSLNIAVVSPHATPIVELGDPRATIVDRAISGRADLLVMGTHGRRGFKRLLLGSVAEAVLREAPCPVLTVPPHAPAAASDEVTFKSILCPIDFSPSALQAMRCALDLARQANGSLMMLHVDESLPETEGHYFRFPEYRQDVVADAKEQLRRLVPEDSRTSVEIDTVVVFGRAHRQILRAAEMKPPDLIVMGAQGIGGVGLVLFGSTTQEVVRGATCPVLTVKGQVSNEHSVFEGVAAAVN